MNNKWCLHFFERPGEAQGLETNAVGVSFARAMMLPLLTALLLGLVAAKYEPPSDIRIIKIMAPRCTTKTGPTDEVTGAGNSFEKQSEN